MLIVQIVVIILAILIGYILAKREYKKFTVLEKDQLKVELRNPILVLFHILDDIGYVIFFIGIVFSINALKYFAFLLIGLGWIINGADLRKANNKRGLILLLLGAITFLITAFVVLKSFWY
jgi:hypothetical protein